MNYNELIRKAINKKEVVQLLCGKGEYEIQNPEFVQDVFPTNIISVLVNCFYKQRYSIPNICEVFLDAIEHMIQGNALEIYIATLYFDTCIFKEESQDAAFFIDKQKIARELKIAITNHRKELNFPITFDNGMIKKRTTEEY